MYEHLKSLKAKYSIVGNCDELNRALDTALKVAPVDLSVLVVGENGTGKEVFPRIIHEASRRKAKRYMAVNCGAIPEGTIDSELFGHVKGAYTGAVDHGEGYFGAANGGTLFLDEVGELPLSTQARLLRVLETGEYIPVGSSEAKRTDVRIVAATNVNLPEAIRRGRFRQDLYYRLNAVSIQVPPLRERGRDVELLFRMFSLQMQDKYGMQPVRLTPEATQMLCAYPWPGNVRQLLHAVENMSITCTERTITPELLKPYLPEEHLAGHVAVAGERQDGEYSYQKERELIFHMLLTLRKEVEELRAAVGQGGHDHTSTPVLSNLLPSLGSATTDDIVELTTDDAATVTDAERELIRRALERNGGKRSAAARDIGLSERTLYRKIKEYGLE
ncbi:MAG: sigma 54-interacting transcriptional regulator [Bacteroidaceae bacterium]|nr:sigma 54-interacting transcriptional regulator [Bacteroidaceae bacterium]